MEDEKAHISPLRKVKQNEHSSKGTRQPTLTSEVVFSAGADSKDYKDYTSS